MDVPAGPHQLQAIKDEIARLQTELDETASIRREAEAVNDPDLVTDCAAAETRLQGLIDQLSVRVAALQKASGAEALRARLQALRTSEARARSLLGSQEPVAYELPAASKPEESVTSSPGPQPGTQRAGSDAGSVGPQPSQPPAAAQAPPPGGAPGGAAAPAAASQPAPAAAPAASSGWQSDLGEAPASVSGPPPAAAQAGENGHGGRAAQPQAPLRGPVASGDSFAEAAFSGDGLEPAGGSAGFEAPASGGRPGATPRASPRAPLPAADFGFGESAFAPPPPPPPPPPPQPQQPPSQPPPQQPPAAMSRERADAAGSGRSISLRDSYPTGKEAGGEAASRPQPTPEAPVPAGGWRAFPASPHGGAAEQLPAGFQWGGLQQSGSGSRPGSSGASEPAAGPGSARAAAPSARSGNPFSDFGGEPAPPPPAAPPQPAWPFGPAGDSGGSPPAHASPSVQSAFADPFGDPFASSQQQQQPGGGLGDFGGSAFGGPPAFGPPPPLAQPQVYGGGGPHHHGPGSHLTLPGGGQYVVTPSMVIPEADWEAAFAPAKPKQEPPEPPHAAPQAAQVVHEGAEEGPSGGAAPQGGGDGVWTPMTEHDRARCRQAFQTKFGGDEVSLAAARELHARAGTAEPLERVFAAADLDNSGRLSYAEFLLFMYLLKVLLKGVALPRAISNERAAYLLGVDLASLGWSGKRSSDRGERAPPAAPPRGGEQSGLETLLAAGAGEEDAKRALFLSGDDLEAARQWLREKGKLGGGEAPAAPPRQPNNADGARRVALRIEKAVLSYKKPLDRPLFQVTVRDAWGEAVGQPLDTPPVQYERGVFAAGHTVVLDTPAAQLPDGAVVYFELKHWKSKEKKWSTLAWTFAAKEAFLKLVDGAVRVRSEAQGMHLYEKPLDPRAHFRQGSQRKLRPLGDAPDLFLRVSEHRA